MMQKLLRNLFLGSIYFLMYVPIVILVIYSFNESSYSMILNNLSLKWYKSLFENVALWQSCINSFALAILSSTIATVIACLMANLIYFSRFAGKQSLQNFMVFMIIVPDIIVAVGLLLLFNLLKLRLGFTTLLIAHISFSIPIALLVIQNRMAALDRNLFLVCQDLGAHDFYSFKKIIMPLIKTSLISAWLLCFTLSFDDVLISFFAAGPDYQILPLYIYSLIRTGIKPEINALCSLVFCVSMIMVAASYKIVRQK